jgi:hypothetical protein
MVLRVNTTKQHDVTTRRYDNVLFDRLIERNWCCALTRQNSAMLQHDVMTTTCFIIHQPTSIIPNKTTNTASNPTISHHYRCKITTESRKVLYIKFPQHYSFKAVDPISY